MAFFVSVYGINVGSVLLRFLFFSGYRRTKNGKLRKESPYWLRQMGGHSSERTQRLLKLAVTVYAYDSLCNSCFLLILQQASSLLSSC